MFRYTVEAVGSEDISSAATLLLANYADVLEMYLVDIENPRVKKIEVANRVGEIALLFSKQALLNAPRDVAPRNRREVEATEAQLAN